MALSISPTAAWDFTSASAPLDTKAGAAITLTQTGGTLNSSGFSATSGSDRLTGTPSAGVLSSTLTFVCCVTVPSALSPTPTFGGIFNDTGSQWAAALQGWDNGGTVYAGRIGGSVGGRYSSQLITSVTEAVVVCTLSASVAKIWYNGSLVLNGTAASISYGAANTIYLNYIASANAGTVMKYAAFYDAEPSAGDITALGSNAASAYSAIFGTAASVAFRPYNKRITSRRQVRRSAGRSQFFSGASLIVDVPSSDITPRNPRVTIGPSVTASPSIRASVTAAVSVGPTVRVTPIITQ